MLFTIGVNWRELTFELTRNFLGWASPASPASGRPPFPISPESKKHTLVRLPQLTFTDVLSHVAVAISVRCCPGKPPNC